MGLGEHDLKIRNRYLLAAAVALLATLAIGSLVAQDRLGALERQRVAGDLRGATEVVRELVRERIDGLARSAGRMADAPGLSEAIAAGDRERIEATLRGFGSNHSGISLLTVTLPDGVQTGWQSTGEPDPELSALGRQAATGAFRRGLAVVDGQLTVFAGRPVRDAGTGETIGGLVMGAWVEPETLARMARLTGTELVLLADGEPLQSTLPAGAGVIGALGDSGGSTVRPAETVEIGGLEYVARIDTPAGSGLATAPGEPHLEVVLLRSLPYGRAMATGVFRDLLLAALLGTLLAFGLVRLGSRRLNRALNDLTEVMAETAATGRMGREDLEQLDQRLSGTEVEELRAAFRDLMHTVEQSLRDRERSYVEAIGAVVAAIDARDHETTGHSFRVAHYALALSRALGIERRQLRAIEWGALLHDVGKIAIPDAILRKTARLTDEEWHVMRQHPSWGYEMLADVKFLEPALEIVYSHHERWDGGGYPRGLRSEEIPLAARIFSVVDTYDSITSDRPYRRARSHGEAIIELCRVAGTQLDPDVVEAFIRLPEVELRRLRDRSERLDLKVRIPDILSDIPEAEDGTWG